MSDMPDLHSNKEPFEVLFSPWREDLAKRIINRLAKKGAQVSYSKMKYVTYPSREILPHVPQSVRGKHVYFLHDLQVEDPNIALMRYILSADALTRSDVASITCVFPNIPYLRQDRREPDERASISAAVVLRLIEKSSPRIRTIITYHMHVAQVTGFVRLPIANLPGYVDHIRHLRRERGEALADAVIAAPDLGASKYARRIRKAVGSRYQIAIVDKEREKGVTRPLESSSGEESHLSALTDTDRTLSRHPALTPQPPAAHLVPTRQIAWGPVARCAPASASTHVLGV